ncbi:hypothetical protein JL37_01540 [Achromobacter sp. RTa]|nr:hypothetical protein JL37_01540 [Achromobacter sp. RTa]
MFAKRFSLTRSDEPLNSEQQDAVKRLNTQFVPVPGLSAFATTARRLYAQYQYAGQGRDEALAR